MRRASAAAAIVGLALIGALVAYFGAGAVLRSLLAVGWAGCGAICVIHLALIAGMGIAWAALLPETSPWAFIWGRLVREAGSEVLPLSQVGGYVLGARAVALTGVSGTAATASTIVDITLEFFTQIAYTAIGLLWMVYLRPGATIATPIALGLAIAAACGAGFLATQRRGFDVCGRFARFLGRDWMERSATGAVALHAAMSGIYGRRAGLWINLALHLACWIVGTLEAWLALRFAAAPLGFGAVLVIESLLYATRSVAFAVPNAVGVQEGAYLLLGASFGLTPEMALALSLLKRARDLTLGLPALAALHLFESGRLLRRAAS